MALALDAMPIGLIIIGSDGRVSYANAQAARWDRVPARQWVGQPLQADCPGWLSATNAAVLRQAVVDRVPMQLREGTPDQPDSQLETRVMPTADGVIVWASEAGPAGPRIHDLMQPLGAITNYAALIRNQSSDPIQRYAGEITRIATAMAATIRRDGAQAAAPSALGTSSPATIRDDQ